MHIKREKVIDMFYELHLSAKEIAETLKVSTASVTKIIKMDARYEQEKKHRKDISKIKKKNAHKIFIKKQRDRKSIEDNYHVVQIQHRQAVREMSKSNHLSNENYRKWNYSAYKYNPLKKRYEFDEELGRPYSVPKYIKER